MNSSAMQREEALNPDELDQIEAALAAARTDLLAFTLLVDPTFVVGPHHRLVCDKLNQLYAGTITRLMIFISPRSSKSVLTSKHLPAWCLGHHPQWNVISSSHSANLIEDFSRDVRNMVNSDLFKLIFPGVELRPDSRAANRWHTNTGGIFTAIGVGGHMAGRGANLALIDDPVSEQDAYSKAKRDRVNKWYPGGLRTRLMPNGRVALVMTRWNENDLAGFLLEQSKNNENADKWEVVKIPAINDEESLPALVKARQDCIDQGLPSADYPEMKLGETYWPVLPEDAKNEFGLRGWYTEELLSTKANTPAHEWSALYMQAPSAEEGNILKKRYWRPWTQSEPPKCDYTLMSMDTAFSTSDEADYSAITTWGIFKDINGENNMILLGAQKGRWGFPELKRKTQELYNFHLPDAVLIEKKASGQSLIQELRTTNIPVLEYQPERDKVARAYACSPIFHGGRIWAPEHKNWADDVMFECAVFPSGQYDDYVDTVTQAVLWVRAGAWVIHPDQEWQNNGRGRVARVRAYY